MMSRALAFSPLAMEGGRRRDFGWEEVGFGTLLASAVEMKAGGVSMSSVLSGSGAASDGGVSNSDRCLRDAFSRATYDGG